MPPTTNAKIFHVMTIYFEYRMVGKVGTVVKFSNEAEASRSECTEWTDGFAFCCWCDNPTRPPIEELMKGSLGQKGIMKGAG